MKVGVVGLFWIEVAAGCEGARSVNGVGVRGIGKDVAIVVGKTRRRHRTDLRELDLFRS